ncbi:MAG: IS3 family transposase [Rhodospirillales bacterium]|nr:IS3 family transposase [Rhodospirillales bacterium]
MGIARSTYYDEPKGSADDTALVEAMHAIKEEFEAYGWRRMQAALRHRGWVVNHKKIKRLMREHALHPSRRRRFVATTDSDHDEPIFPDRSRDREVNGPNQLWVAGRNGHRLLGETLIERARISVPGVSTPRRRIRTLTSSAGKSAEPLTATVSTSITRTTGQV